MKCENCGNEVREGAKFCSKCGSNILEQQEDHSGKHNVHETKTEKRCVNCGNVLREESKFCPKCGSSTLEQKEDVSTLKDEEKDKAEQSKGTFYFEKVKMIGRLRYKIIRTEVSNNEERLEISQKIHRFLRKEKENHLEIKLSEIGSMELKTKMDFWDTLYAALFGVMFLMNITDVAWLLLIAVFLYTGYGRQHLAQHDAVETLSSLMDKMTVNCLCYGALGSLLLYPILDELVHGFLRTVIVVLIAVIVGVSLPLYFCYQLCEDIDKQLGYSIWDILEVEKKQEIWSCIKFSMLSLAGTLIFVCPILVHFAE